MTWICHVTGKPRSCWSKLPSFRARVPQFNSRRSYNIDPESFHQYANGSGRARLRSNSSTNSHEWNLDTISEPSISQLAINRRFIWPKKQRVQLAPDTTDTLAAQLEARNIGSPQIFAHDEHRLKRVHGLHDIRAAQVFRQTGTESSLAKSPRSPRLARKPQLTIEIDRTATRAVAMRRTPGVFVDPPHPGSRMM